MKYKDGVYAEIVKIVNGRRKHLQPSDDLLQALEVADILSKKISGQEIVVTSLFDGTHSKNSLHYSGNAADLRVWIYTEQQITDMVGNLQSNLGKNYDVMFEGDHIHIEFDPK